MRALSAAERAVLDVMLAEDFPGAAELRQQADAVVVSGVCGCGCPSVNLEVRGDVPLAQVTSRTPINANFAYLVRTVVEGGLDAIPLGPTLTAVIAVVAIPWLHWRLSRGGTAR